MSVEVELYRTMQTIRTFEKRVAREFRSGEIPGFVHMYVGEEAIVGGGIALATGAGLAARMRGSEQVAVAFFGDGAVNQGVFHESLNLAAIWQLPVIFLCENNQYAVTSSFKTMVATEN